MFVCHLFRGFVCENRCRTGATRIFKRNLVSVELGAGLGARHTFWSHLGLPTQGVQLKAARGPPDRQLEFVDVV